MSVEQVKVKEYTCSIQKGKFLFIDSMRIIILIDSRSDEKFYFVNASTNFSNFQTLISRTHKSIRASWCQWHKQLAHLNMTDVKRLVNMNIDIDVNLINSLEEEEFSESICETCVLNKQHWASSRRFHTTVIRINELIHLNLVDDGKILMIDEEFRYVVIMIDDYSQYTIIYLIDWKFDLKNVLQDYLNLMKNQDTLIHWLHSDNEEKYVNHHIIDLLKEHEIKWKSMTSYNSSQNEVAEQCFCILFERTRAILSSVNLSIKLWKKAIMTVIYLKNRSFIIALNKITLYEAWHDKKSDLSYLHTFKCVVYHHVKKAHWKLDDKSLKCQFLDYKRVNQYCLWNEKKVLISSHVQWDEIVIKVEEYDENVSILSFDDQINDHQTRTSVASQKIRSRSLELESELIKSDSSSDTDILDASSECFKRVIAELIDYKTLNDLWIKNNQDFVNWANWIQIELNTSQTVKQARVSLDWKQWKLAFRSELNIHIKNNIFILKISSSSWWILSTRWITIIKQELKEKMIKYKAKWVCKRFHQKQEINYDEIFVLMIRVIIIKMLLALTIKYDYEVE